MYCLQVLHANEIAELKAQINTLTSKVTQLLTPEQVHKSQSNNKATGSTQTPNLIPATKSGPPAQKPLSKTNVAPDVHDRKYNIVLYGMHECPKGTNRLARTKQDLEKVTEILTGINKNISSHNVRDCFGLGKYKENNDRPRPVLIKMNRSIDIINLLAVRNDLPPQLAIKRDLTPKDRQINSILMKDRWSLIQSGQNKKILKYRVLSCISKAISMVASLILNLLLVHVQKIQMLPTKNQLHHPLQMTITGLPMLQ